MIHLLTTQNKCIDLKIKGPTGGLIMARITIEDCLKKVENRFVLVHMVAKRVRQLRAGSQALVSADNKDVVIALREVAAGKVTLEDTDEEGEEKESSG
jgi:DNA-directed RNA polymerase subunit omega